MPVYVGLLRAVNLPGHNRVPMTGLTQLVQDLGFTDVVTYIQSGNVVFGGTSSPRRALEETLEGALKRHLGVSTDFLVRRAAEWDRIIRDNPFPNEARDDPGHLVAMLLKATPDAAAVRSLEGAMRGPETVQVSGDHAYIVYPEGTGHSRLTALVLERHLGTSGTGRNWNSILKLGELSTR